MALDKRGLEEDWFDFFLMVSFRLTLCFVVPSLMIIAGLTLFKIIQEGFKVVSCNG